MNQHSGDRTRESQIRTELDAILERLNGRLPDNELRQKIRETFPDLDDQNEALAQLEARRHFMADELPGRNAPPDLVCYPVSAEPTRREFRAKGQPIARGSSSAVYDCELPASRMTFISKVLVDPNQHLMRSLALHEWQALVGRRHPNVVSVFEVGKVQMSDGNEYPYVSMEKLPGDTLLHWFESQSSTDGKVHSGSDSTPDRSAREQHSSPFFLKRSAEIVSVLAEAVAFCHRDNITHGDISPNNVMVCGEFPERSTLKLIDFGLSGIGGETPGFGDPTGHYNDLESQKLRDMYSLGAMLYYCATGDFPLTKTETTNSEEWLQEHRDWVQQINFTDRSFTLICRKALSTRQRDRYQNVEALAEDLRAWLNDEPLPHVRKGDYSWWQTERLLWKRSRESQKQVDHFQIIGRLCLIVVAIVIGMCSGMLYSIANGELPHLATQKWGVIATWSAIGAMAIASFAVRLNPKSLSIFEPVLAALLAFQCIYFLVTPSTGFASASWSEEAQAITALVFMLGIVNVSFAAGALQWQAARPVGWLVILVGCFMMTASRMTHGPQIFVCLLGAVEVLCCLNIARYLLRPKLKMSAQRNAA